MAQRNSTLLTKIVFLVLTTASLHSFAQELLTIAPEVKSFKLGAYDISVLRDGALLIPNDGSVFGLNASRAAVAKTLGDAGAATDKIRLDIDTLLIRMPKHWVLLDTGYGLDGHGVVLQSLAAAGVAPRDITDILITHAHPDHIGGLVNAQGQSVFANAVIRMSAGEWKAMLGENKFAKQIAAIKAQVQTFEAGDSPLPGITAVNLAGHTSGHVGYEVNSQGQRLLDIGDMAHSSIVSLAHPDWTITWDADKAEGAKTRSEQLQQLVAKHELIFAPHFPFPGIGYIEREGDAYRFQPRSD